MNLRRPAIRRPAVPQFRLVDGVILAAVAVLALRVLGLFSALEAFSTPSPGGTASGFARVLSHARSNYEPADPTETGSVSGHGAPPEPAASGHVDPAPPEPKPVPAAPPPPPMPSASERAILQRLGERRDELQTRSREMESREKLIEEQERKIEERIGELKATEKAQAAPGKRADAEGGGLKNLVTMYETMKPKEAARVFDRLPQDVLVSVVTQMNPRKMAEVLAIMTPEGAQKLTVALARRAAGPDDPRVPTQAGALPAGELPAIVPTRR